jgi:hypothetical protein
MQLPERRLVAEARWAETSGKGYRWEDRKQKTEDNDQRSGKSLHEALLPGCFIATPDAQ